VPEAVKKATQVAASSPAARGAISSSSFINIILLHEEKVEFPIADRFLRRRP